MTETLLQTIEKNILSDRFKTIANCLKPKIVIIRINFALKITKILFLFISRTQIQKFKQNERKILKSTKVVA